MDKRGMKLASLSLYLRKNYDELNMQQKTENKKKSIVCMY